MCYPKKEVLGKPITSFVAERSASEILEVLKRWRSDGIVKSRQIWAKRKNGSAFPTLLTANSLYDVDGKRIGYIVSLRDMSEIHAAKQELEQQKIKHASDMGALSSRIAHDLKNPLSVIKNSVELMKMSATLDSKAIKDYERIERATVRISHQIEEVLEYVWPRPLNPSETSLLSILKLITSRNNLQKVEVNLPSKDVNLTCDASKMEIVFSNLILNAIQAMDGIGKIYVRTVEDEKSVTIEIEDTGHGIPSDLLPKIFEPMFTTRQIGTGLGLVSCKTIVEKHGGTINVKTQVGKGTTFIIRLPKNQPASSRS